MAKLKGKEPVDVDLNMHGQAVDGSSITLSSYIGTLAREHVPVTLESWKQLDNQKKDIMWSSLLLKEAKEKGEDPAKVTRVDVWIKGHKSKANKPLCEAVQNILNEIDELRTLECPPNDSNLKEDSLTKVLGPEKRGQVRGLGFGATPSQVNAQIHSRGRVKELEAKLKATNDQVASLQEMVTAVVKQNEQSQHGSVPMTQGNSQVLENARCQLLHWYQDDDLEDQVVAEGRISSTDPKDRVHHMPLGRSYWRVWVDAVINDIKVCRPTDEYETLEGAIGSSVAWLKDCIKLL
ncbi:hypothetical protein Q3G72_024259 [Acer saccharum]|nr:hypothetical protein Q3G72_024259 [Acer saccharum]